MSLGQIPEAVTGGQTPTVAIMDSIGKASATLDTIVEQMTAAKAEDTARWQSLNAERQAQAAILTDLQKAFQKARIEEEHAQMLGEMAELKAGLGTLRTPSKAAAIGGNGARRQGYEVGSFIAGVLRAGARDAEMQAAGKAILSGLSEYQGNWGKATAGDTDAAGGWIVPNAIVDEVIIPGQVDNIYRQLMTVVPGVTAPSVDMPFRSAARTRASVAGFNTLKDNQNLAYNGYTATMYTLARIYDIGNQFLRQSQGAAERDVFQELAAAFAQGESYYIREGSGSSQPYGYTAALTNGPSAYRSTFSSPADTTIAGSMAAAIAVCAGALAGRGVKATAAVVSATSYWNMLRQGSDNAGFWFATQEKSPASIDAGTLISPFGIPVFPDADADLENTAAVIDNLVVANWKKFKVYFGQDYRVDTSTEANTRWDYNLTGFRGEEEMGFDARPAVYAGHAQMITDIVP